MNSILKDFLKVVKEKSDALAIKCENEKLSEKLSYKQLDGLSSEIAIHDKYSWLPC
ncbi:MAG: hypothetical protein LBT66_09395 [Methanobrevibacter sp.]|jgi:hypothetical protein|nr:hypothetical protein [Candidatus Methanovirga meridionalis]